MRPRHRSGRPKIGNREQLRFVLVQPGDLANCEPGRKVAANPGRNQGVARSEEHTSELQSLMRISYAVFCLKTKKNTRTTTIHAEATIPQKRTNNSAATTDLRRI